MSAEVVAAGGEAAVSAEVVAADGEGGRVRVARGSDSVGRREDCERVQI